MIQVTPSIALDEKEITVDFVRASGPGGQNVNKVSTAVELHFDVSNSPSLPDQVKQRLLNQERGRISESGILTIEARRFRTQLANRQDAVQRLIAIIQRASYQPSVRHPTKPTHASKERRLEFKRRHSQTKRLRSSPLEIGD